MRQLKQHVRHFLGRLLLGWAARLLLPAAPPRRAGAPSRRPSPEANGFDRLAREQAKPDGLAVETRAGAAEAAAALRHPGAAPSASGARHAPLQQPPPAAAHFSGPQRTATWRRVVRPLIARMARRLPAADREPASPAAPESATWRARTPLRAARGGGRAAGRASADMASPPSPDKASADMASPEMARPEMASTQIASRQRASAEAASAPERASGPLRAAPIGRPVVISHRTLSTRPATQAVAGADTADRPDTPPGRESLADVQPLRAPAARRGNGAADRLQRPRRVLAGTLAPLHAQPDYGAAPADADAGQHRPRAVRAAAARRSNSAPSPPARIVPTTPAEPVRDAQAMARPASGAQAAAKPPPGFSSGQWPPLPGETAEPDPRDPSRWPLLPRRSAWGMELEQDAAPAPSAVRASRLRGEQRGVGWSG